jgi:hypothetical protein
MVILLSFVVSVFVAAASSSRIDDPTPVFVANDGDQHRNSL